MNAMTRSLVIYAMKRASLRGYDPYNSHSAQDREFRIAAHWLLPR